WTRPGPSGRRGTADLGAVAGISAPLVLSLLGLSLGACTVVRELALPSTFHQTPDSGDAVAALRAARGQVERQRPKLALGMVEKILSENPDYVDAQRVRQDILRERGRLGLVLREAEDRLARDQSAAAFYLSGRIQNATASKQQLFQAAIDRDPEFFWGWFGLAFTLRQDSPKVANQIYQYLYQKTNQDERTAIAYAASLMRSNQPREAEKVYQQIRRRNPGLGSLGVAQVSMSTGAVSRVMEMLQETLRRRPHDSGARVLIALLLSRGMSDDWIGQVLDVLREDPKRLADFERLHGSLLAALYVRAGDPNSALSTLRRSHPLQAPDRFVYRTLLISTGDVAGFLADLRATCKREFLEDPGNQVMGRWRSLIHGAWMASADPLQQLGTAVALTRALVGVGYLEFADRIATRALLRHDDTEGDPAIAAVLDQLRKEQSDVRKEIAFESEACRVLRKAYRSTSGSKRQSLPDVFAQLRRVSLRVHGRDVVGQPSLFTLPFVGVLVDSLGPGLPAHLARFNKHLVMGQRNGGPVEAMILTRLSVRHVDPVEGLPLPPRCTEVIGEHRQLEPMEQGDLAGIALLNHYVVDMDEVRAWAGRIAERRRIAREDGSDILRDVLPQQADALEAAGVEWRLSVLSPVEDSELETAVLDIIRWHERGHMADFLHYLPVSVNLLRSLALVVRNGLSAVQVTAEMEGRAQLTALAMSPYTRLALAHTAGFLSGEQGDSPHAIGFRATVSKLQAELQARSIVDGEACRWHLLDPAKLRETARKMLAAAW
ncbi:MAG: hypothetical protein VX951_09670, partial [Planctomycetota bacterium]|nr:hypothetical protein [Planctomycetota bacterium]